MENLKNKFPKVYEFFKDDDLASTTFLNKYALKDLDGNIIEDDPKKTIERVMSALANVVPSKEGYNWKELFIEVCNDFKGVCPQGSVLSAAGNTFFPQSLSNCFVIESPHDSISGIMKTSEELAQVTKRRGGVGVDISTLRPYGSPVKNAARSSTGAYGFMNHFSNTCRTIAQLGRRGALMICLDIKHPDAELFAKAKLDLKYCTGANVSLKISDEFMKAVVENKEYVQQWPIDSKNPQIKKVIKARELWKIICNSAWEMGEPGILMWNNIIKNLPADCYPDFKTIATNPCGELPLSVADSCRLASICLTNYVKDPFTKDAIFDFDKFEKEIRIAMRMMDAVVSCEINAIKNIIEKVELESKEHCSDTELVLWNRILNAAIKGRRTGLGTHGLADCLAQLTLKYDSKEALEQIDKIYSCLRNTAYDESVEMAKEYGAFPVFDWNIEKDCEFIKRLPEELKKKIKKYGRRNSSVLTNAPTGTISIMSGCSSGIEPTFRQMYLRRRKINPNDVSVKVDFVDDVGDKWMHFPQFEKNVQKYFEINQQKYPAVKDDEELSEHLPSYFITSDKINWKKRIEVQSTIQKYIDHSISSTINLPKDVSKETVAELYEMAWEKGLKGITVYRDGSRTGVLVSDDSEKLKSIKRAEAPERPDKLPCEVHFTKVKGEDYVVIAGLLNGSVYEVFFGLYDNQIPNRSFNGFIEKKGKSKYILNYIDDIEVKQIDINKYFDNKDYEAATRLISTALRHGTPLYYIVDQLQKSSPSITEYGAAISRVLKKYIKIEDMRKYVSCKNCDSKNIQIKNENGCCTIICLDCSTVDSKCS